MKKLAFIFKSYLFVSTFLFIFNILYGTKEKPLFGIKLFNTRLIFIVLGLGAYVGAFILLYKIFGELLFFIPTGWTLSGTATILKHWEGTSIKSLISGLLSLLITGITYYKLVEKKRKDFLKYWEE